MVILATVMTPIPLGAQGDTTATGVADDEIGGVVWLDVDADGVNASDETGFTGAEVVLYDAAGEQVETQVTGADGRFSFDGLPGDFTAPFRIEVGAGSGAWPDPANWLISGPPHPGFVGTDQDATPQVDPRRGQVVAATPGQAYAIGIRPRPVLSLGFFGPGVIDGAGPYNTLGHCADTEATAEPGDDCGPANGQIKTQDVLSTIWSITADNFEPGVTTWGPVVFEQVLRPTAGNAAVVTFESLPVACKPPPEGSGGTGEPASMILVDVPAPGHSTLVCNLGSFAEGAQRSLTTMIKVSGASANGSAFATTQRVYVPGGRAVPDEGPEVGPITVSARPAYDLAKIPFRNRDVAARCVDHDGDPSTPCQDVRGFYVYFLIRLSAAQQTGIEALQQPLVIRDHLTAHAGDPSTHPPIDFEFYITHCAPNPSTWGDTVMGRNTYNPLTQPLEYRRAVADSGTCTYTRDDPADNGSQYTFTIDGADLSGRHYPTESWNGSIDFSAGPYIAVEQRVQVFIPFRAIDAADGTMDDQGNIQLMNALGDFDPVGLSGISNYGSGVEPGYCDAEFTHCAAMDNGTASNNRIGPHGVPLTTTGSLSKYVAYRTDVNGVGYTIMPGSTALNDGAGVSEPGDYHYSFVQFTNSGANSLTNAMVCDVIDPTMVRLTSATNVAPANAGSYLTGLYAWVSPNANVPAGNTNHAFRNQWRVEYGRLPVTNDDPLFNPARVGQANVVDAAFHAGVDTYSLMTGRFEGIWTEQRTVRCDDDATVDGAWHADPSQVPGGIEAVNAIRVVPAGSGIELEAGQRIRLNVPVEVRSHFVGGPRDGQLIPAGAVIADFAAIKADNINSGRWSSRAYQPSPLDNRADGDRSTVALFSTRLEKRTTQPVTAVGQNGNTLAGNPIVWELIPSITAQVTPSTQVARDVTIVDVLPPRVAYNPACTEALAAEAEGTILPDLIEPNTGLNGPQDGYTRLTYRLGDRPANAAVARIRICTDTDPLAPHGTAVTNHAVLSAEGDVTSLAQRSDDHVIALEQNGSMQIGKAVDRRLDPLNDDQVYTIEYANFAASFALAPPTMIDVLPWNGDGPGSRNERTPGSSYHGTLDLVGPPSVRFLDGSVPGSGDTHAQIGTFSYTADDPATINADPDNNTSTWCIEASFGTPECPADWSEVTAIRFVSNYELDRDGRARQGQRIQFTLQAEGNHPSDRYTNRATVDTASLDAAQYLRSNNVTVEVAGFNLGDLIFGDTNRNGRFDPGADRTAPDGVPIELYRASAGGDLTGTPVAATVTDADGRYLFTGVGEGDYVVVIPAAAFADGGRLEGWALQPLGHEPDPNTDHNEHVDHHGVGVTPGTTTDGVRTGIITLSARAGATVYAPPTGDEPLGDNVAGLAVTVGDDFTNLTLDIALIPPVGSELVVTKFTNGASASVAPGVNVDAGGPVRWTYHVTNDGPVGLADVVVSDDNATPATDDDFMAVRVSGDANGNGILDPGETWVFAAEGEAVVGSYRNRATATATPVDGTGVPIPGVAPLTGQDVSHYWGAEPGIELAKFVQSSFDANEVDEAPSVAPGGVLRWRFDVTNTGNVDLTDVTVTDDHLDAGAVVDCGLDTANVIAVLVVGQTVSCWAEGTAPVDSGVVANEASVRATAPDTVGTDGTVRPGVVVTDTDVAHYRVAVPGLAITKRVQTVFDADVVEEAPLVAADGSVRFVYTVTNVGDVDVSEVVVVDDVIGSIGCPAAVLAAGAEMTCAVTVDATAGPYRNTGAVTGRAPVTVGPAGGPVPGAVVSADDLAHYVGAVPALSVTKLVNGMAAPVAPGLVVESGSVLEFTYTVTNTGNVDLTEVALIDDRIGEIVCPQTVLAVGEAMMCIATDAAPDEGGYVNTATATGRGPDTIAVDGTAMAGSVTEAAAVAYAFVPVATIEVTKSIVIDGVGHDANAAPFPTVEAGSVAEWRIEVTNTGNVEVVRVEVTDTRAELVCPGGGSVIDRIAPGETVTCVATSVVPEFTPGSSGLTNHASAEGEPLMPWLEGQEPFDVPPTVAAADLATAVVVEQAPTDDSFGLRPNPSPQPSPQPAPGSSPSSSPTGGAGTGGRLPLTGSAAGLLAIVGLGLAGTGSLLLSARRRTVLESGRDRYRNS